MGVPMTGFVVLGVVLLVLVAIAVRDRLQKSHTIVSNFPLVGRFRYWFEELGGPLRQYIVTGNDEERPFSRDQRRWIYASSKKENSYFGFGTDNDLEQVTGYVVVRHPDLQACMDILQARQTSRTNSSCSVVIGMTNGFSGAVAGVAA